MDWQVAEAPAGAVEDGIGNCGGNARNRHLAEILRANAVESESGSSMNSTSMEPISAFTGSTYRQIGIEKTAEAVDLARKLAPIPQTTPPRTWLWAK